MVRNFEKFEVGHWYIYTGEHFGSGWSYDMKKVLNHKPVVCSASSHISIVHAAFVTNTPTNGIDDYWNWGDGFDNWIEIKDPSKEYHLIPGEKFYNVKENVIQEVDSHYSMRCSEDPYYALIDSKEEGEVSKFKVGDKVRIIKKVECDPYSWVDEMEYHIGKCFYINELNFNYSFFKIIDSPYWFPFECAELVEESGATNESIGLGSKDTGYCRNTVALPYSSINPCLAGYDALNKSKIIDDFKKFAEMNATCSIKP